MASYAKSRAVVVLALLISGYRNKALLLPRSKHFISACLVSLISSVAQG